MFDGIKILDLWVSVATLLTNHRLNFVGLVNEDSGQVISPIRDATDRGLTFTLIPTKAGERTRCELQGSLHRYGRAGLHNADQFTVADLLAALDQLVTTYGIDPFRSRLNNVEFGVNVLLPFPAIRVLDNLISYKGLPLPLQMGKDGFAYCQTSEYTKSGKSKRQYVVKLYDKGTQYGIDAHVLRVEVKVMAMNYLNADDRAGGPLNLHTLNDLLNVETYGRLGALLVEVFTEILFDEPTISVDHLTPKERDLYQNGRNPRFWSIPDDLPTKEYNRQQRGLKRAEQRFRTLVDKHRTGANWQSLTAALIGQTWQHLTTTDDDLLTAIDQRRAFWQMLTFVNLSAPVQPGTTGNNPPEPGRETVGTAVQKCPILHGVGNDPEKGELSDFQSKGLVVESDTTTKPPQPTDANAGRETVGQSVNAAAAATVSPSARYCKTTGLDITHQRAGTVFVTTSTVRQWYDLDRGRFDTLADQYLTTKQAGADLDKRCYHIAHNIRNTYTNPRNNPVRPLKKYGPVEVGQTLPLFAVRETVRLTDRHLTALEYRRGTRWELPL